MKTTYDKTLRVVQGVGLKHAMQTIDFETSKE